MFLNAVILILQEILEAALLVSVLLVLTRVLQNFRQANSFYNVRWVWIAIGCGVVGAWGYAMLMPAVAQWFDYAGQEVVNSALQCVSIGLLLVYCYGQGGVHDRNASLHHRLASICLIGVITLAITREGSEIILYMQGIIGQREAVSPVLLGSLVAAGIGISSGIILYFLLLALNVQIAFRIAVVLLGLFSGNMAAQSVLLLTQADWLPYSAQVWDSSGLIAEYTVSGQLLYALVGYEATPSLIQVLSYLAAFVLIALSPVFRKAWFGTAKP